MIKDRTFFQEYTQMFSEHIKIYPKWAGYEELFIIVKK